MVQKRKTKNTMSYILDALKKVEREKAKKIKAGGITSISGDLFQERMLRPSRGGVGKIIVVILLVSLVTFAATWFVLKDNKKPGAVAPRPVAVQPTPPAPPASAPVAVQPTQQMAVPRSPEATVSTSPVLPQPGTAVSGDPERVAKLEKKSAKKPSAPSQQQKAAVQTIPAPADIKVSGIAWQEERIARRVVVNGFLLQEGTTVSGAKILEIHPDRVRFTSPAGIFDVRMDGAATLTGPPK
jgi:general secretion pathway protein B